MARALRVAVSGGIVRDQGAEPGTSAEELDRRTEESYAERLY